MVVSLGEEIASRTNLLQRLVAETASVEEQRRAAQDVNGKLRKLNESHHVAPVLDYVREAASRHALLREVASLERKVDVAQGELQRCRRAKPASADSTARVAFGATMSTRSGTTRARWGQY
jgi:hypothetical protein